MIKKRIQLKIIALIAFILQISSLIIFMVNPLSGYELSIYTNVELAIFFLFLSIICGIVIVLSSLTINKKKMGLLGFIILANALIIFFSIPLLKGYVFYDFADPFSHIGITKDIIRNGHFSKDNFYPIFHLLLSELSESSSLPVINIMASLPILLSIFFIISFYLLNNTLFTEHKKIMFASLISLIPFVHIYYTSATPNGFSFMVVPMILFLYFKTRIDNKIQLSIMIIIFIILIPFTHPLTTIMLIVFLTTLEISSYVYPLILKRNYNDIKNNKLNLNLVLISLATFFTWISSYIIFNKSLSKVVLWTMGELSATTESISSSFGKLNFSLYDQLLLILKMYLTDIVLIILLLFTLLSLLKKIFSRKVTNRNDKNMFILLSCFFVSGLMMIVTLVTGDPNLLPMRSMNFVFLISVPTAGYGLYLLWEQIQNFNSKKQNVAKLVILCFIAFTFIFGCLSVYDSPYINKPTPDVTKSHIAGMKWFFENKNQFITSTRIGYSVPWRFAEEEYGSELVNEREDLNKYSGWDPIVPDNLGYNNSSHIGELYNETRYLPISLFDKLAYTEVWQYRYSKDDFQKLDYDKTINKIFNNGNVEIWVIH